jgi:hypothetical protein
MSKPNSSTAARTRSPRIVLAVVVACSLVASPAVAEPPRALAGPREGENPFFVGTSLFTLFNLIPYEEPPHFGQLNAGYRLTSKDALSLEAITWTYYRPLGIPYGSPSFTSPDAAYPGRVREWGVGVAYQRFLWNGLYGALHATPFLREYYDAEGEKTGNGFQLFVTLRLGYHVRVLDRVFLEPSVACTTWPLTTNVPAGFAAQDKRWPSYFLFEPGFHAGVEF